MPFTDDDLKRLKEEMVKFEYGLPVMTVTFGSDGLNALLARLEAAEVYRNEHPCVHVNCTYDDAWRKAAGKESK